MLFRKFGAGSNPVIEKIRLPTNASMPRVKGLPARDGAAHARDLRETEEAVDMIRHNQKEIAGPPLRIGVDANRLEKGFADQRIGQWRARRA
jgi:hypothetical protein